MRWLESSVTGAEKQLLPLLPVPVPVAGSGVTSAVCTGSGTALLAARGVPHWPGKVNPSPLADFANGMCFYKEWEVVCGESL